MSETWRAAVGFPGYEVSDLGHVRSLPRVVPRGKGTYTVPGRVLRPFPTNDVGHLAVDLLDEHRQRRMVRVHTLVLTAFVGPRPEGMEGCHGPLGATENAVTNLRWDTHLANAHDTRMAGTHVNTRKVVCPLGHPLVAPNLRRTERSCLACNRAWATVTHAARRGIVLDRPTVADEHYAKIMAAA